MQITLQATGQHRRAVTGDDLLFGQRLEQLARQRQQLLAGLGNAGRQ